MRLSWISLLFAATLAAAPADLIISAGQVVTMDAKFRIIPNGAVAIAKGRILAVGTKAEIDKQYVAVRRIDRPEAILAPGLINTHTHAAMSLLRGVANDLTLEQWLQKYIFPAEKKNVTEEFVRVGTRLAMLEMMLGGTTTFTDMYYFEDAVADEAKKAGMRGVLGETIIGFPVPDNKTPEDALAYTEKYLTKWAKDPLITAAVAPHALYTNSPETLKASRALANRFNAPLLIHVSETQADNVQCSEKYGQFTPTGYLDYIGLLKGRTLFAHAIWLMPLDQRILLRTGTGVAHCPSSNMMLGSGIAHVTDMRELGVAVGLGTDGPAGSNNDFDMFEEMDLASKLAKSFVLDPRQVPAKVALTMATIDGARALGMDKEIGSLEAGKRADLITVDSSSPNAWPAHDPVSMLVYSLKSSNVQDVVIEGKVTVQNKRPLTLDPITIRRQAAALRAKVDASLK